MSPARIWPKFAAALGVLGLLAGLFFAPVQTARSYWWAWLFWGGLSFGAVAIVALQALVGGRWSALLAAPVRAIADTLPLTALLFVPACFGLRAIFPWAAPGFWETHADLPHHRQWLQPAWWMIRAALYLLVLAVALAVVRRRPGQLTGGLTAVAYMFTMNFAAADWAMSLDVTWHSTIFAVIFMCGQFLSALALCAATSLWPSASAGDSLSKKPSAATLRDTGNLLLAFVVFWAYITFSQFLIIWSGNLPDEIAWYVDRRSGGWVWIVVALGLWQFVLPFALLLSRGLKERPQILARIALGIFAANALHWFWLVAPAWSPQRFTVHWLDAAAFLGVGGMWLSMFDRQRLRSEVRA